MNYDCTTHPILPFNSLIQSFFRKTLLKHKEICQILTSLTIPFHSIPKGRCMIFRGGARNLGGGAKRSQGRWAPPPPLLRGWVSCTPVFPTGECWQVGLGLVPNWFLHFSCAPWSDMRWLISYKVVARGAFRKPSTRSGWAAFTHLSFGSPSCSFNFI
jgi:hypothetical protein